jgi:hypothetical protein
MSDITNADLARVEERITDSVRHEVGLARQESARDIRGVHTRISELTIRVEQQNGRVSSQGEKIGVLTALVGTLSTSIDRCWRVLERRKRPRDDDEGDNFSTVLTAKQKAGLWTVIAALASLLTWVITQVGGAP